jgi:hypothetical protein
MPIRHTFFLLLLLCSATTAVFARPWLGKTVSVQFSGLTATAALDKIAEQSGCRFSYKSDIFSGKERYSIVAVGQTVKQVLDELFQGQYHYSERSEYIIIHPGGETQFVVSGYVRNGRTGEYLSNVTVYEDQILASAMTNERGFFKLPIKNRRHLKSISIIARKDAFSESYVALSAGRDHELELSIVPDAEIRLRDVLIARKREKSSGLARWLLSSRQKMQSLNIGDFLAERPIQTSIVPGVGTHMLMGAQVVNHFSLNWIGGYTAGVDGFEAAGAFNINRGNIRYFQTAGVFNSGGGTMTGMQSSGVFNWLAGSALGFQAAGAVNIVGEDMKGFQASGLLNRNGKCMYGFQSAGLLNVNGGNASGFQASGLVNFNAADFKGFQSAGIANHNRSLAGVGIAGVSNTALRGSGAQLSGVFNYARRFKGLQLGLVNIADTMEGVGLGLINYYGNGYHVVAAAYDESGATNLSWVSGTKHWYSLWNFSARTAAEKAFHVDYGFGNRAVISKKLSLQTDLSFQTWYIGHWDYTPLSLRLQSSLVFQAGKRLALFAGPSYTVTENKATAQAAGYIRWLQLPNQRYDAIGSRVIGWGGWQVGVRFL